LGGKRGCFLSQIGTKKIVDSNRLLFRPMKYSVSENTKRLSVDLTPELHAKFKTVCAKHGLSMGTELRRMISERTVELTKQNSK
jgi:outer membrane receptor for monomeric catechols